MSSLSSQGTGADPLGPAGAGAKTLSALEASALRRGARVGRTITVVLPLALIVHAAAWMLVGAGPLRVALAWSCTVVLAVCLVTAFAVQATSPVAGTSVVYWGAWQTALRGSLSRWWRLVLAGLLLPAYVVLLFGMGSSALEEPSNKQQIAESGARIVVASVERAQPLGKTGDGRAGYRARYDVHTPEGRRVQVEFVNERNLHKGDSVYVGYAPGNPGLQPVGDDERSEVEQQLSGRPMNFRVWVGVLIAWAAGTVALVVWLIRGGAGRLPGARMKRARNGMSTAPAHIKGHTQYVVSRPNKSPDGFHGLEIHSAGQGLALQLPGCSTKYAGAVLAGQGGQLEWPADLPKEPEQNLLATTPADFVSPDGRRLAGNIPTHALQNLAAQGAIQTLVPPANPAHTTANAVDLGATWPFTLHRVTLLLLIPALALPIPLYAIPHTGGLGVGLLVASAVSAAAAVAITLYLDHKHAPPMRTINEVELIAQGLMVHGLLQNHRGRPRTRGMT